MEQELNDALELPLTKRTKIIYNLITVPNVDKSPLAGKLNQAWLDTVTQRFTTSEDPQERMWLILRS